MMDEPSVLDYVKARLMPWKYPPVRLPAAEAPASAEMELHDAGPRSAETISASSPGGAAPEAAAPPGSREEHPRPEPAALLTPQPSPNGRPAPGAGFPWRSLLAILLALLGQRALEPPNRAPTIAILLYLFAFAGMVWAYFRGEWTAAQPPADERWPEPLTVYRPALLLGLPLALLAFWALGGDQFTTFNLLLWGAASLLIVRSFWLDPPPLSGLVFRARGFLSRRAWGVTFNRWSLLVLAVAGFAVFYHVYRLNSVPPEMISDHAEKLLDVWDVLHGQHRIFFPRNTGREAIQFYVTAGIASLLGTGLSFLSLKIGTTLAALLTLPFIYLLGKELGSRRIGLLAVAFAGISYWHNLITRLALRFALYPLFVAPALYFLVRGIRRSNRNDFILAGIFLGIGLHGYTPIRILPFVLVAAVGLYLLHRQSKGRRMEAVLHLSILALVSLVLFLPLLRFALQYPDLFAFRAFSRVGTVERPLPGPALPIFLSNLKNAMLMFGWDNGEVWTVSIPHRPALDVVSAALFHLGFIYLLVRYLRRRHWLDLFLLLSVPLLMLPSILSLAFPAENPVLSRTGGALVVVFIIVAVALDGLLRAFERGLGAPYGRRAAALLAVALFAWAGLQNYDLVFKQYYEEYRLSSWNTSEMGQVIRDFAQSVGTPDSAWVMGFPYWVDTRLVGMNAGYPNHDYALFVQQLPDTLNVPGPKLFLLKPEDQEAATALNSMYPQGWLQTYHSQVPTKDFLMFFVPPGP